LTIFHNPASDASVQALKFVRQASVKYNFDVDIVDSQTTAPTHQQVSNIVSYLGHGSLQKGCSEILVPQAPKASTVAEVQKILDANPGYMMRPLVVDWNKGKAVVAVVRVAQFSSTRTPCHRRSKGLTLLFDPFCSLLPD
jgi:arsenate reductase-like glutaredoxin family protein